MWRRALTLMACVLTIVGCSSAWFSPSVTLNVTAFEPVDCEQAHNCYSLEVAADGQGTGQGSCSVVAVDATGAELWREVEYGDLQLSPESTFTWVVELPEVTDTRFQEWLAGCEPQGEG